MEQEQTESLCAQWLRWSSLLDRHTLGDRHWTSRQLHLDSIHFKLTVFIRKIILSTYTQMAFIVVFIKSLPNNATRPMHRLCAFMAKNQRREKQG